MTMEITGMIMIMMRSEEAGTGGSNAFVAEQEVSALLLMTTSCKKRTIRQQLIHEDRQHLASDLLFDRRHCLYNIHSRALIMPSF